MSGVSPHKMLFWVNSALVVALLSSGLLLGRDAVMHSGLKKDAAGLYVTKTVNLGASSRAIKPLKTYAPVVNNNIFGFDAGTLVPISMRVNVPVSRVSKGAVTVNLKVVGTVAWMNGFGYAIVVDGRGKQTVYRTGDIIPHAGILHEVLSDRVIIDVSGQYVEVMSQKLLGAEASASGLIPKTAPIWEDRKGKGGRFARMTADGQYVVNKKAIDASIKSPERMFSDARLLPNFVAKGRQEGFKVTEIVKGGLYDSLGMKNGDILLGVNDFKLKNTEAALKAFTALRGMDTIKLSIVRDGNNRTITYNIR